jgi:hypothetical protein
MPAAPDAENSSAAFHSARALQRVRECRRAFPQTTASSPQIFRAPQPTSFAPRWPSAIRYACYHRYRRALIPCANLRSVLDRTTSLELVRWGADFSPLTLSGSGGGFSSNCGVFGVSVSFGTANGLKPSSLPTSFVGLPAARPAWFAANGRAGRELRAQFSVSRERFCHSSC